MGFHKVRGKQAFDELKEKLQEDGEEITEHQEFSNPTGPTTHFVHTRKVESAPVVEDDGDSDLQEYLDGMTLRELQKLAKENNISAGGKKDDLIKRLITADLQILPSQ